MQELEKRTVSLRTAVEDAVRILKISELQAEEARLREQIDKPDFWNDSEAAQDIMKQQSRLRNRIQPWQDMRAALDDLLELTRLHDESLKEDLFKQCEELEQRFEALKHQLKFAGQYDDFDAILSIHAGAGGTDAQDWTAMLLRMYVRWAERNGMGITTLDQAEGDEAGLKRITLEISGDFAYGKLKSEHGVHRLVRLSPFNADALRQTSFAKVDILPKVDRPDALQLNDKELKIDVYRAGGHGGQSVNTTDSAVRVTHLPTGLTVAIQNERSQLQNKETALTILRSRLIQLQAEQHKEDLAELKGPNQSAEWGNQIRSYVLHPYKQVKDLRTRYETSDAEGVLDGDVEPFITAYLEQNLQAK